MSASYATRRCLLPEDGGCGRELPASAFARYSGGVPWGHNRKCEDCRRPFAPEALAEGQRLYEAGEPMHRVAEAIGRSRDNSAYRAADAYGWDKEARATARAEKRQSRATQCVVAGCYRLRVAESERCDGHTRKYAARAERIAARSPSATRVTIRCHVCHLPRVTTLAAPVPCPRCGTSGATPVGVWDEEAVA